MTANVQAGSDPAASSVEPPQRFSLLKNRPLMTMMLGHFTVDMYSGVIPLLYPLLTDKFDLSLSTVGLVSLAYSGMSSITQPLFGMFADRKGTRLIGLSMYRLDINFRESAVLGLVGAGGIGATLNTAFDRYEYDTAAAILIIIIVTVMALEYLSGIIRARVQ